MSRSALVLLLAGSGAASSLGAQQRADTRETL